MSNILFVTSSPRRTASYSNQVAAELLMKLEETYPDAEVTVRDLAGDPLPHIDDDFVAATRSPGGPQTDAQRAIAARSDLLVDELMAADTVVIAAAMINFTIPSTLKSWIDYIARPGRSSVTAKAGRRASSPASACFSSSPAAVSTATGSNSTFNCLICFTSSPSLA
jgi:FMN-dependent NADH-azoreductase